MTSDPNFRTDFLTVSSLVTCRFHFYLLEIDLAAPSLNNLAKNTLEIINVKRRQQIIDEHEIKNIFLVVTQKWPPENGEIGHELSNRIGQVIGRLLAD